MDFIKNIAAKIFSAVGSRVQSQFIIALSTVSKINASIDSRVVAFDQMNAKLSESLSQCDNPSLMQTLNDKITENDQSAASDLSLLNATLNEFNPSYRTQLIPILESMKDRVKAGSLLEMHAGDYDLNIPTEKQTFIDWCDDFAIERVDQTVATSSIKPYLRVDVEDVLSYAQRPNCWAIVVSEDNFILTKNATCHWILAMQCDPDTAIEVVRIRCTISELLGDVEEIADDKKNSTNLLDSGEDLQKLSVENLIAIVSDTTIPASARDKAAQIAQEKIDTLSLILQLEISDEKQF